MNYKPSCPEEVQFLHDFDPSQYQNPAVAADTALFALDGDILKILLIKRGGYPYKDMWALPGGFVNIDENVRDSAQRELLEETGLADIYCEQAFVWGEVDRDPRQRVVTISYIALADYSKLCAKAGDDAAQAEWFAIEDYRKEETDCTTRIRYTLSGADTLYPVVVYPTGRIQELSSEKSGGLAFDHAESIAYSVECLKRKVRHSAFLEFALDNAQARAHVKKVILKD